MAKNNQRGRRNNNPEGHNQYSGGWMDSAKDRPMATAAAAAAAVGAGVFLWSRRNQISDQISNLSDQISEWSSSRSGEFEMADGPTGFMSSESGSSNSGFSGSTGKRSRRSDSTGQTAMGKSQTELSEEALSLKETGKNL